MMNLLKETLSDLGENGKTPSDVRWVGSRDGEYACSWSHFAEIADFQYSEGYGSQKIACDLVVVGDGWWLERHEYDGAEQWVFKLAPTLRYGIGGARPINTLGGEDWNWDSVSEMNGGEDVALQDDTEASNH